MQKQAVFIEKQKFKQWWLWLIIISIDITLLVSIYKQIYLSESLGENL